MSGYYIGAGNVTAGANKTAIHMIPGTGGRNKIYEVIIGCQSTPAAQAAYWALLRSTGDGTGTGITPSLGDPADVTSRSTVTVNHSAEPTYTAALAILVVPLNQQATMDWKANPGKELIVAASATAGAGMRTTTSTGTAVHSVTLMWEE